MSLAVAEEPSHPSVPIKNQFNHNANNMRNSAESIPLPFIDKKPQFPPIPITNPYR